MSTSVSEWANMTAEERKALKAKQQTEAIKAVENDGFPTGVKLVIGGKEFIARPVRQTESGGVTYSIQARPTHVGKYSARLNKFNITLLGEGMADAHFESEDLL